MPRTKGARAQHSIDREKQILQLLAEGKTNAEIADAVFICESHVRSLLQGLRNRAGVKKTAELITFVKEGKKVA